MLTKDTELPTRFGIVSIGTVVEQSPRILVAHESKNGVFTMRGYFDSAVVKPFGERPVWEVVLVKQGGRKTIRATADHRWFVQSNTETSKTTQDLAIGDALVPLRATRLGKEKFMPVAAGRGFVFGDGTRQSNREFMPTSVTIHTENKLVAAKQMFLPSEFMPCVANKKPATRVANLPRYWKDLPPLGESRAFLASWLSGYFAADGSVSKSGSCVIESVDVGALQFVREAASVCGIGCTGIRSKTHSGMGKVFTLYRVVIRRKDLPDWFFLQPHHHERASSVASDIDRPWKVESVRNLHVDAMVFGVVGVEARAFALTEDLLIGTEQQSLTRTATDHREED